MMGFFGGGSGPPPDSSGDWYQDPNDSERMVNGGYQSGSSDMGGYANAIGGGTKALVGLMFGNRQMKLQKKMVGIQHDQVTQQHKKALLDSSESEVGMMGQHKQSQQDANAQMAAQGIYNSSGRQHQNETANYHQDVKLNALRRAKAMENSGYDAQVKIWDLQKKQAKAAQQEALIAAGIDTAISVASIASDRRIKHNVETVDVTSILERLEQLPISTWRYEWERNGMKHMGPMAQDFHKLFDLGEVDSERPMNIDFVDLFGVLFASVKGLAVKNRALEQRVRALERK